MNWISVRSHDQMSVSVHRLWHKSDASNSNPAVAKRAVNVYYDLNGYVEIKNTKISCALELVFC